MMTFPACYQHIPKVRLGILVPSGQFPSEVSSNKQRLLSYLLQLQRTPLLTCQQIKERRVRETSSRGDFFVYRWPLPGFEAAAVLGSCCSLNVTDGCVGRKPSPFLTVLWGLEGAWKELSSSFPASSPNPQLRRKKKEREKERKQRIVLNI